MLVHSSFSKRIFWGYWVLNGAIFSQLARGQVVFAQDNSQARQYREQQAPAVMAAQGAAIQQAQERDVFEETVKRLRGVEQADPKRALAEYRRFLVGKKPSPTVGVQAAIKVAQLRENLHDISGALQTCDVFASKYVNEPSSVFLLQQKLAVRVNQKQLAVISQDVEKMMPQFLSAGPEYYGSVSEALLKIERDSLDGSEEGKARAGVLCQDVEQIYLRWLKRGTASHTWQMFEALRTQYQEAGDERRASELLPKVADELLQMVPNKENPEIADISLMAARWLLKKEETSLAYQLYSKIPGYGNSFVSQVAITDQGQLLLKQGKAQSAIELMGTVPHGDTEFGPQWVVSQAYWQMQNWEHAEKSLTKLLNTDYRGNGTDDWRSTATDELSTLRYWKEKSFEIPVTKLTASEGKDGLCRVVLYISSLKKPVIKIQFSDESCRIREFSIKDQSRRASGVVITSYNLVFEVNKKTDVNAVAIDKGQSEKKFQISFNK